MLKNFRTRNLNISLTDREGLADVKIDPEEMYVSVNFEKIVSVEFFEDAALVIVFENGELYIDITREEMVRWAAGSTVQTSRD